MNKKYNDGTLNFPTNKEIYMLVDEVFKKLEKTTFKNIKYDTILHDELGYPDRSNGDNEVIVQVQKITNYKHGFYRLVTAYDLLKESDSSNKEYYLTKNGIQVMKMGNVEKYIKNIENPPLTTFQLLTFIFSGVALVISAWPKVPEWINLFVRM